MHFYKKINGKLMLDDVDACVQAAVASSRIEGNVATEKDIEMLRAYASGEITIEEYKKWALKQAGVEI